jgi:hypothetical protein
MIDYVKLKMKLNKKEFKNEWKCKRLN